MLEAMASVYCFCPAVLGLTDRPRDDRSTSEVSTSEGRTSSLTMSMVRPTCVRSSPWPDWSRSTSSSNSRPTRSASSPSMEISLPRTTMWAPLNASSTRRSSSSRWPRRPAIRWLPGTRILTWVDDTCALCPTLPATRWPRTHGAATHGAVYSLVPGPNLVGQPGGQSSARPPNTWRWRWGTELLASGPTLKMSR